MATTVVGSKHCSMPTCRQLDFLPFVCSNCKQVFCLEHREFPAHGCPVDITQRNLLPQCPICSKYVLVTAGQNPDERMNIHINSGCTALVLEDKPKAKRKICGLQGCRNPDNLDLITCRACQKHFCLAHRHPESHRCPSLSSPGPSAGPAPGASRPMKAGERLLEKLRLERAKREQQQQQQQAERKASSASDPQAHQPSAEARRAAVQRLRVSALGDERVKDAERVYFEVLFPERLEYPAGAKPRWPSRAFFFSRNWTIGRALDYVCEQAGVENRNNVPTAKRLVLRVGHSGVELPTDCTFALLDPALASGDTLRLEYDAPLVTTTA